MLILFGITGTVVSVGTVLVRAIFFAYSKNKNYWLASTKISSLNLIYKTLFVVFYKGPTFSFGDLRNYSFFIFFFHKSCGFDISFAFVKSFVKFYQHLAFSLSFFSTDLSK